MKARENFNPETVCNCVWRSHGGNDIIVLVHK